MMLSTQLVSLEELGNELGSSNYDVATGFKNCTATVSSTTAGVPSNSFPSDAVFWTESDSGKYTCRISSSSNGYNYLTLAGREALTTPATNCQASNNYGFYILRAYSRGDASTGDHQIVRIYMNGCTRDVKLAMTLLRKSSGSVTNSGRFEFTGNPDTHSFIIRTAQFGASSGTLMEGAGVSRATSGTANYVLKFRSCSNGTGTCTLSGSAKTMCMQG